MVKLQAKFLTRQFVPVYVFSLQESQLKSQVEEDWVVMHGTKNENTDNEILPKYLMHQVMNMHSVR